MFCSYGAKEVRTVKFEMRDGPLGVAARERESETATATAVQTQTVMLSNTTDLSLKECLLSVSCS